MKSRGKIACIILACFVLNSCYQRTNGLNNRELSFYGLTHDLHDETSLYQALKLVVFWDEDECSTCRFSHMTEYEEYRAIEKRFYPQFRFIVIVVPKEDELSSIRHIVREMGLENNVLYDEQRLFYKENRFLPRSSFFHYFLVDKNNMILMSGDPFSGRAIKQEYDEAIITTLTR